MAGANLFEKMKMSAEILAANGDNGSPDGLMRTVEVNLIGATAGELQEAAVLLRGIGETGTIYNRVATHLEGIALSAQR